MTTTANDLVFDTVVIGNYNLTVGANQTQQWNTGSSIRGGASTEAASGTSTTMSWTSGGTEYSYWAIGAVPVKPVIDPPRGTTLFASPKLVSTGDVITWTATFTNANADTISRQARCHNGDRRRLVRQLLIDAHQCG